MDTREYAPGRRLDVHGDGAAGVVLLWHGRGTDSRAVVADLAREIAGHGLRVVVPDWDSAAPDGGRSDLLASLEHARGVAHDAGLDPDRLVVAGWSLGGTAAVGLVRRAPSLGVGIAAIVLLSPGDGPRALDPFTGAPLPDPFPSAPHAGPVHVVSAAHDEIATPQLVRGLEARLRAAGWPTTWTEVDADHGSIAMTRYDAEIDRFVPADDPATVAVGRRVAEIVASASW
ncbi:hypothetical protein ASC61_07225 [Aeromicrobium sp. Root344]|uniref:alpha/beta hydrolase n=1 Tax=Aeromicrobium sp. Root344 TaxID=1736521 RepID=UPI0006FF1226|nr:alpha/beta hydrolase fold domain-containing protein [Aeromicrobium sp. Root344]KQV74807.1 hypothetical protein ASC61_07225 [Aeromicrobium sp. Root344]